MNILRVLGFKDFLRLKNIVSELKDLYSDDNFESNEHIVFIKDEQMKLWMIGAKDNIYFVLDNGVRLDVVYRKNKKELKYTVEEGEKVARLVFPDSNTKIPFDKSLTGGTETVTNQIKKIINE